MKALLKMLLPLSVLILVIFFLSCTRANAAARFSANQSGNILQLSTPYGSKIFMGDLGFERLKSYRFEIPLKDLKPQALEGGGAGQNGNSGADKKAAEMEDEDKLIYEANRLYNLGQFHDAMSFVEELLKRNSKNTRGWVMKGSLYHVLKQKDLAKKAWEQAIQLEPENTQLKTILENYQ